MFAALDAVKVHGIDQAKEEKIRALLAPKEEVKRETQYYLCQALRLSLSGYDVMSNCYSSWQHRSTISCYLSHWTVARELVCT